MTQLVLASGSSARRSLLATTGLDFIIDPADVDEDQIRSVLESAQTPVRDWALELARAKAADRSPNHPGALVLAADQILVAGGDVISKVSDLAGARQTLRRLSGTEHQLIASLVLFQDGREIWSYTDQAALTMRALSDAQITHYLDHVGEAVLGSVGCYHYEGFGVHLFEAVSGSYHTILGLPLLPLLVALRDWGLDPMKQRPGA